LRRIAVRLLRRVGDAGRGALRRAAERITELRYGVATSAIVYHEDLGLETENRVWHDPSSWFALQNAFELLAVSPADCFADLGAGLGRVLIVAAMFPFRRVTGVEVSEELTERARENVERSRAPRQSADVQLVTADAVDWHIPPDLTVAYLYSPFTGELFERVIERLLASVDEHPRPLRIVYNYPVEHNRLVRTGRVRVLSVAPASWPASSNPADVIVTYLVLPSDERLAHRYAREFPVRLDGAEEWADEYEPGFLLEKPDRLGGIVLERPRRPD
jgi:SAM-dependent methyltransferase